MAAYAKSEIVLYDLACTQGICFSPTVWRIRIMLNYKQIPYTTIFLEFPEIGPTLKSMWVLHRFSHTAFWIHAVFDTLNRFSFLFRHVHVRVPVTRCCREVGHEPCIFGNLEQP